LYEKLKIKRVWQRRVTLTPASETVPIIPQYNDR
jgi:hypothetical protein